MKNKKNDKTYGIVKRRPNKWKSCSENGITEVHDGAKPGSKERECVCSEIL